MAELETIIILVVAAVALSALARRLGAPYPVFLAVGGAILAFIPGTPSFTILPELALALFVAPVLLDAAFDFSLRDLKDNWVPVTGLVVFAVGLTTIAVAYVARILVPDLTWPAAIALGAIVAPPDAAAATAVLGPLRPPHRIMTILEGESLLNDASALLIYRLAIAAAAANGFHYDKVVPTFLLAIAGSFIAGPVLGWIALRVFRRIEHVPTAIIVQFVTVFGVWILADRIGLSGVLTMVCFAMTVARTAPQDMPARLRIPTNAVWETVVFALNILAFIFIGLQVRPILGTLNAAELRRYAAVAGAVLITAIVTRFAWQMPFNKAVRMWEARYGFRPPRPTLRPTLGSGLIVAWAGMRGIVSLAAALALPSEFPFRNLILLTAFAVVLGTMVVQGLTLKPLLRILRLEEDDPVMREVQIARERALEAALATFDHDASPIVELVRKEFMLHLAPSGPEQLNHDQSAHAETHRTALHAARQAVLIMRTNDEIGDDAFHLVEEELDWHEMSIAS